MTGCTTITRDDIHIYISDAFNILHNVILKVFADNADEFITDNNKTCENRKHNGIRCMSMFDSMVAAAILGKQRLSILIYNTIAETLNHDYKTTLSHIVMEELDIESDNTIVYWDLTNE